MPDPPGSFLDVQSPVHAHGVTSRSVRLAKFGPECLWAHKIFDLGFQRSKLNSPGESKFDDPCRHFF